MTIPEWAKPLIAARERGATLQIESVDTLRWVDEADNSEPFSFSGFQHWYRIKPGTDPGERKVDPLISGTVVPAFEPVPVRDEYVPLTDHEAEAFFSAVRSLKGDIKAAHRSGWERRRTP